MALTNEQITAKNFKEFYEQIRPYLNGSFPTPVANKMSRGDLYSTNERMIGQWIDGKPIYQKTVDFGALPNNTTKTVPHNISNIGKLIDIIATADDGDGVQRPLPIVHDTTIGNQTILNINTTEIWCRTKTNLSTSTAYVTIRYTKSTDSAIKIGNETDYSEDEQIIGTWVDGKPLYQKTVDCGALPNNTTKKVSIGVANIDNVKNLYGYGYAPGADRCIDLPYSESTGICLVDIRDLSTTPSIRLVTNSNFSAFTESYVTVQYTKTTD